MNKIEIDFKPSEKQWEVWEAITNHDSPYTLVLAGGAAGGGKSYLGSVWLITSCLKYPDWRAVVARKELKALKESTLNTILGLLKDWNIPYNFNQMDGFIQFENGSRIILKEMSDLPSDPTFSRFGSSEYSCAFVDEVDQISQKAIEVLSSRLRWKVSKYGTKGRLLMSTNPCINWVRDRFVMDHEGSPPKLREFEKYIPFTVFDNPDENFRQDYIEQLERLTDQAERERLLYGNWDYIDSNDATFYNSFDGSIHLKDNLFKKYYDRDRALFLSFDFNIFPYVSCLAAQVFSEEKKVRIYKEILGLPKKKQNKTIKTAALAAKIFKSHEGLFFVTGDPSGIREDTRSEQGQNDFTHIMRGLRQEGAVGKMKIVRKAPSVSLRGEWLNTIFDGNEPDGWTIEVDMECRKLTEDFLYGLAAEDGGKDKKKVTDPETGARYEKYHHLSDAFDYLMLAAIRNSFYLHKKGGKGSSSSSPVRPNIIPTSKNLY